MGFRRSVAAISGICALSLTLGRGNTGCEKAPGDLQSVASIATAHGDMHSESQHQSDRQKPCKSTAVVCCMAMTSCGLSLQLTRVVSTELVRPNGSALPTAPFQSSLNRIPAPEPPPPKA